MLEWGVGYVRSLDLSVGATPLPRFTDVLAHPSCALLTALHLQTAISRPLVIPYGLLPRSLRRLSASTGIKATAEVLAALPYLEELVVTRSADDSLNSWTLPVNVVETTLGTPDFIDPSLAVDANGDLTVSFIQIYRGAQDPQMKNVLAVSQNGGATFHVEFVPSVLKAAALPFNCASKRYDLGNQRKAMSYGGRSLHSLRISFPPPTH